MAAFESISGTKWQLLPSRSVCRHPRVSPIRAAWQLEFRRVSFLPCLGCRDKRKPSLARKCRRSMQLETSLLLSEGFHKLSAMEQGIFSGGIAAVEWSTILACGEASGLQASRARPTAGLKDKVNKGLRKTGRTRTRLMEKLQRASQKFGLEREFGELPQWSAYVPILAVALETLVIVSWNVGVKGDLRGAGLFNLSGEGLLTLLLGVNFVVGWLASQMSTWRVQALPSSFRGLDKKAASPGIIEFFKSFTIALIPYGNFLAWTRFSWKQNSPVSSLNAIVYVLPSLVRLVFWSQGLAFGKVEQIAWLLGAIHRPYDAARLRNEKLLAAANSKIDAARKAKEVTEQREKGPELTVDEMVLLQQRQELEEFDMLLAKRTDGTTTISGHPQDWSVGDTVQWLAQEGFARYGSKFADNDIDGAVLLLLSPDNLRDDLGIQSLGDRRKLEQAIARLKSQR